MFKWSVLYRRFHCSWSLQDPARNMHESCISEFFWTVSHCNVPLGRLISLSLFLPWYIESVLRLSSWFCESLLLKQWKTMKSCLCLVILAKRMHNRNSRWEIGVGVLMSKERGKMTSETLDPLFHLCGVWGRPLLGLGNTTSLDFHYLVVSSSNRASISLSLSQLSTIWQCHVIHYLVTVGSCPF